MFQVNDLIMYGSDGVCRIEDTCVPDMPHIDPKKLYYKIRPLFQSGVIYAPTDTNVFMRHVIRAEKAREIIDGIAQIPPQEDGAKDARMPREQYDMAFQSHECLDLIRLIKLLYQKEQSCFQHGKRLNATDSNYRKKAETLLYSELAVALDIPVESVKPLIAEHAQAATATE